MAATVLITGSTGFTGGYLTEAYARLGWEVHGTCLDPSADVDTETSGITHLHTVDLRDAHATRRLVSDTRPDVVHHLAAQSSVRASLADPAGTLTANILAQLNVLEAVSKEAPSARVIAVGSCDEYGRVRPDENPVGEEQALRPLNPYAVSKVAQDLMGYQYAEAGGLDVVRVRPFLQLGPRRSDRFVAGSFARQVAQIKLGLKEPVIEVGTVDLVRDFTDVRDVANALVVVAERGVRGSVYNIASGVGHSLRDLLKTMLSVAGASAEIRHDDALHRGAEPPVLIGDSSRLRSATGWEPAISFDNSAADTLHYWCSRLAGELGSIA